MTSSDAQFLASFGDGTISNEAFDHEAHVRLAYLHLSGQSFDHAVAAFKKDLLHVVGSRGAFGKYNETITLAFLILIKDCMNRLKGRRDWNLFRTAYPQLFQNPMDQLFRYYRKETLLSERAKLVFVQPDIEPLPILPGVESTDFSALPFGRCGG